MPTLAGYDNTRQDIINTLVEREIGTQITPEAHQHFVLALLEYIRSVELISASTLIGKCTPDTDPVQPNDANVAYVGSAPQHSTTTWLNFRGYNGQPLSVTTTSSNVALCVFTWNKQYWTVTTMTLDLTDLLWEIDQRLDKVEADLKQEIADRQAGDTTLNNKITAEANTRANADQTLQNNINAEATARTNADNALDGKISAEATTRANADSTLQTNINNEATARQNADNTLDGKISAEATARQNADNELKNQIGGDVPTTKVFDTDLNQYQNKLNQNGIIVCASVVNTANVNTAAEKVYHLERNAVGLYIGAVMRVGTTISRVPAASGKLFSYNNTLYEYYNGYLTEISASRYNFDRVFDGGRADTVFGDASRNINSGGAEG